MKLFGPADILLPRSDIHPTTWACVACDQYTSQPEYWAEVNLQVGEKPSTLRLMLPEVYLAETAQRVRERLYASDDVITELITPEKEAEMIRLLDQIHDCIRKDLMQC